MEELYRIKTEGHAEDAAIIQGEKYRFTVLTEEMIRLEYCEDGQFEDRATQCVIDRKFKVPEYQVIENEESLEIITDKIHLVYNKQKFTDYGLSVQVRGNISVYHSIWHFGEEATDLRGTARTLDEADGAIELEHGIISRFGYGILDDSRSLVITEDGWVEPRKEDCIDIYFLGYGHEYEHCLKDYYHLTGKTPLLPRYALGNWWSRFYRYNDQEYKALMTRFEKEEIPFSVSVIDMDWHLVDIDPKYGSGWTGYTWNKELFPDPKEFMTWLHDHGLKVTLNVHPAGGVQAHEEKYKEMAEAMGRDWEKEEPVNFDVTDQKFLKAYFEYLHHPNEEEGVDFWWLDWQQGGLSKIPGLDPLWMLNHYHYLDSGRRGKRRLTFSRYAGMGSHRYPVGFSGDTIISWESLAFQPYFTANASNVGYGWWSHDIGGHMKGYRDEELSTRWIQFGVFSPIMRLHSSNSAFTGKEPWNYNAVSENIMKRYLKLRHEMIPYLYTMNYHASHDGQPLIRPMYYLEPEQPEAYEVPNEYYFGTELVVCPITEPTDKAAGTACVKAWIPEGKWYDIFSGLKYDGGRMLELYRSLEDIPVLAKEGAIIPLTDLTEYTNSVENPKELAVKIVPGKKNAFILMEDTGDTCEDKEENWAQTKLEWINENEFIIHPANGNLDVIPKRRTWKMEFYGIADVDNLEVTVGGKAIETERIYDEKRHICQVNIPETEVTEQITISFSKGYLLRENNKPAEIFALLYQAKIEYEVKEKIYAYMKEGKTSSEVLGIIQAMHLPDSVYGMLSEVLLA
ncbi:glycoside hydrolase family 31 protein [Dorea amylophila]|jgi:alpha-glucosidase (family GH31 glycosyl hydrolase)|uniref:glycoside hydrolase family 31 protein n=1 Tax=Dorea amylophila TaxID=2981789 RepID=UPI0022E7BD3F|nr:glycoside hydrolase family 31 protein [Dorea amylophila]